MSAWSGAHHIFVEQDFLLYVAQGRLAPAHPAAVGGILLAVGENAAWAPGVAAALDPDATRVGALDGLVVRAVAVAVPVQRGGYHEGRGEDRPERKLGSIFQGALITPFCMPVVARF